MDDHLFHNDFRQKKTYVVSKIDVKQNPNFKDVIDEQFEDPSKYLEKVDHELVIGTFII